MPYDKVQYRIKLSKNLYKRLKKLAKKHDTTVADILRDGVKWMLLWGSVKKNGGRVFIQRSSSSEYAEEVALF